MIKKQVCLLWLVKNLRTTCFLCFFASMVGSFLVPVNAEAQNIQTDQKVTVKGVVKDEKGEPAIGASVVRNNFV